MTEKCEHTFNLGGAWGDLSIENGKDGDWQIAAEWTEDAVAVKINYCPFCGAKLEHETKGENQ